MVRSKMTKTKSKTTARKTGAARKTGSTASRAKTTATRRRTSPGISRIDQEATRTHGYFVRVGYERTPQGTWRPRHRAFFGDASYGGKTKALRAAKEWLAEVSED
jgi:hypothetical protein